MEIRPNYGRTITTPAKTQWTAACTGEQFSLGGTPVVCPLCESTHCLYRSPE